MLLSAKREFYNNSFEDNKNNARAIWKTIKTVTGSKRSAQQITSLRVDGCDVDDATEMADQLNLHFSTIADKLRSSLSGIPMDLSKLVSFVESRKDSKECFSVPAISSVQVKNIIMKLNPRKSSGIDKIISAHLLRSSAAAVTTSIARLINLPSSSGKFPSSWKTAKVTPLLKNGLECDRCNFCPISVLPVLSKIIERHFHDSLYDFVNENNLIYSRQSGFRRKHSTETALIKIIDELLFNLDKDRVSGMVLVDYPKAFVHG